jgi:hypothetical protein
MLTIREFGLIFGRLCFVLGNQVASKYTNLLAFRLRIVKWEVEETFDNLDIAYLTSKLKRMRGAEWLLAAYLCFRTSPRSYCKQNLGWSRWTDVNSNRLG